MGRHSAAMGGTTGALLCPGDTVVILVLCPDIYFDLYLGIWTVVTDFSVLGEGRSGGW